MKKSLQKDVAELLDKLDFKLVRTGKHLIYQSPGGRIVSLSHSPSDSKRASLNMIKDIKRAAREDGIKV